MQNQTNNQMNNRMQIQMQNQNSPFNDNDLEEFDYQNEEMDVEEGEVYNIENGDEDEVNFDQFINDENAE